MSESPQVPVSMHGAVDLSSLARPQAENQQSASATSATAVDITEANLNDIAQRSTRQPVIMAFVSAASPVCGELTERLGTIVDSYGGSFAWGTVDVDAQAGIAQALQITAVPAVLALIGGRPAPLFQGNADESQIREVLDQVLDIARQSGMDVSAQPQPEGESEPEPEPVPPLHQAAYDALERDDLDGAAESFRQAMRENPKDADARAGLAQVELMARTRDLDLNEARAKAADHPEDVDAQLAVADLDVSGGKVDDAFVRLIDVIRATSGDERDRVRKRLIDLFEVVGPQDSRVLEARKALAAALY